ncbi:MAG: hypothetical protein H0X34_15865 [Chthoniobacterales bacterium]|nr:hypothetical protein [Chthoniobacterales bacterium]
MSDEEKKKLRLEIAHVLFVDIVGYSKLLISEQSDLLEHLKEIVRGSEEVRTAEAAGKLIRLATGDGMALVFRNSPEAPAQCALELARADSQHPELQLRMGIHSGPINEVVDVNDRANVTGAGINLAQRVMDCGDAGHILLSQHVADDLEQYEKWRPLLHVLGECEVKHGVRLRVVNLYTDELGNPAVPEKFQRIGGAKMSRVLWREIVIVLLLIGAFITGAMLFFHRSGSPSSAPSTSPVATAPAIPKKSIAVLPFEYLSEEKANAYFADGVQDEILTDLARIADLKVISRTSVIGYRETAGRNLRKIGQELGVAHLLEGSVHRAGARVRVNAQLIDARTDAHLWAQTYDRDLADVFAIQSEIAKAIADQLEAKLSPNEKSAIEEAPTSNVAAFDFYTQARNLMLNISFTAVRFDNLRRAITLLEQAVAIDSHFFLAYVALAEANDQLYSLGGGDHTPARLAAADAALARVTELRPSAGETSLAVARHRYHAYRDFAGARTELAEAARSLPNEPAIMSLAAFIDRRAGQWEEAVRELSQAIEHDPRNIFFMQQLALTYQYMRRYAEMAAVLDRAIAVDPARVETKIARAQVELHRHADTRPLHDTIQEAVARDPSIASVVAENWINLSLCRRDVDELARALTSLGNRGFGESAVTFDPSFGEALGKYLRGDSVGFHEKLQVARSKQEETVRRQPDYSAPLCALAIIDAMLGRKDDALKEGQRAVELTPVSTDAVSGTEQRVLFAVASAWAGAKDQALDQLEAMTKTPCFLSYGQLKLQPYWDPLRGDPRFEQIVASLAPKETSK